MEGFLVDSDRSALRLLDARARLGSCSIDGFLFVSKDLRDLAAAVGVVLSFQTPRSGERLDPFLGREPLVQESQVRRHL
jgi:hypothetical protein